MIFISRKGSASIEFSTTYGWLMLLIVGTLLVITYFGIMNPESIATNKCEVPNNFDCVNYNINEHGEVSFTLNKKSSEKLLITNFECYTQDEYTITTNKAMINGEEFLSPINFENPMSFQCKFLDNPYAAKKGLKEKANFRITLEDSNSEKLVEGKIYATIQEN